MSDSAHAPAIVAREARSIHAGLKTLLARDVWGNYREADFQRKNLRRRYLHLLLLHPTAREARDAGTHLWMQTSYAFIALYKQRLARPAHQHNHNNANTNNNGGNNNGGGPVETRKLLQRFRQFLADEERFWRALVLRIQRAYAHSLSSADAMSALVTLPPELLSGAGGAGGGGAEDDGGGGGGGGGGGTEDRMNHFGFPPASAMTTAEGGVDVDEPTARSVLSKALVCLGDIARYREQYKVPPNAGGKGPAPKKAHAHGQIYFEPRPNYAKARALYMAAHALAPGEGNAAHQLAILAGYESDTLSSVSWYLRALCVRAPFDTAGENLAGVLTRVLTAHRASALKASKTGEAAPDPLRGEGGDGKRDGKGKAWERGDMDGGPSEEEEQGDPPRVRIDRFKRDLVLLHALWRDGSAPASQTLALAAHTARAFARLVAARALPEELIVRVVFVAQGAVWVGRMIADSAVVNASAGEKKSDGEKEKEKGGKGDRENDKGRRRNRTKTPVTHAGPPSSNASSVAGPQNAQNVQSRESPEQKQRRVQAAHLAHLLALHAALLSVGVRELGEVDVYAVPGPGVLMGGAVPATSTAAHGGQGGGGGEKGRRHGRGTSGNAGAVSTTTGGAGTAGAGGGGAKPELAERISAEFRRTLPALRVASKWMLGNWSWVGADERDEHGAGDGKGEESAEEGELRAQRVRFWATYAEFLRRLSKTFPGPLLPKLSVRDGGVGEGGEGAAGGQETQGGEGGEEIELELELEEDVDVRGWLPLRGLMGGPCPLPPTVSSTTITSSSVPAPADGPIHDDARERRTVGLREEVHPNVEQLMRIADLLRDARRVVAMEGSPLALYGGQFVVKGVEAAKPTGAPGIVPPPPVQAQAITRPRPAAADTRLPPMADPLASIPRDVLYSRKLAIREDDEMTEQTSRTDDDILHDAFSFLNRAESETQSEVAEGSDDGDEIVWDLRGDAPLSPVAPTARTSPKTPVRLPPIGPPSRGPLAPIATAAPPPLSPFRVPLQSAMQPITPGTQIPATTALDLLNTFSKAPTVKPGPMAPGGASVGAVGTGIGGGAGPGSGESLLFGARATAQSIWSASRDEQGLMFAGGTSGVGGGVGQQPHLTHAQVPQFQGIAQSAEPPQYFGEHAHTHAHAHHQRFASQDLASSQGSTIWASSYPSASQQHVPSSPFGRGQPPPTHRQRVVSNSMAAAQLFPSGGDQYGYGPLSAPAPQYVGGMAPEEQGVLYATSGQGFAAQQGYGLGSSHGHEHHGHGHARHLSLAMLDPRAVPFHGQTPMSQLWGNAG